MVKNAGRPAAFVLVGMILTGTGPAAGACNLTEPEAGTVATVIDGETFELSDGRSVRLMGAKAPLPPLGWRGEDPWPFVAEAKAALETLALGKVVELRFGGRRSDRHGHLLAHAFAIEAGERLWLQEEMVAKGLARVYSFADSNACVPELLLREKEARAKRLGIWGVSAYRILDATDLARLGRLVHTYQLVEGKVVAVGEGGGRLYLNFAKDWRTDFTVSIARKSLPTFSAAGIDLKSLAGKRIRVRGALAWRNGPMIEASHPEQIELVPEDKDGNPAKEAGPAIAL
jgi:micrococcal nuclease